MFFIKYFLTFGFLILLTVGCTQDYAFQQISGTANSSLSTPDPVVPPEIGSSVSASADFTLQTNSVQFTQDQYPKNQITAQFRVLSPSGLSINNIDKSLIQILDGGQKVSNFELSSQTIGMDRYADIVIILDVTTSMDSSIDKVKSKIGEFVSALSTSNIKSNLCLVMFGETTEQTCNRWVLDDPKTPQNENLDNFMRQINNIATHGGGTMSDENQLPAVEAAAQITPWHTDAQRVAILITDAGFHYAPDNIGEGVGVPTYDHTLNIIKNYQMQTFVVSMPKPGYSQDLKGYPSMPAVTGGDFYNLSDVLHGKKDMTDVFNSITGKISSSYTINYAVDDNLNLNPELKFSDRNLQVFITDPQLQATVKVLSSGSSLPNGHPKYKNTFTVSSEAIDPNSVKAWVNGQLYSKIIANGTSVAFEETPGAGALVQVSFFHLNLKQDLALTPLKLQSQDTLTKVAVTANGHKLTQNMFVFTRVDSLTYTLELKDSFFNMSNDPWDLKKLGRLHLEVVASP